MPLAVVERPPFFLFRRVGAARAEDFVAALARLRAHLQQSPGRAVAVYDAGEDPEGSPDAQARRTCAEWLDANEPLLRSKLAVFEFAARSPLSRGVLTAIFWLRKPPFETVFHASARAAVADAIVRSGSDAMAPDLLRDLDAAARALR